MADVVDLAGMVAVLFISLSLMWQTPQFRNAVLTLLAIGIPGMLVLRRFGFL